MKKTTRNICLTISIVTLTAVASAILSTLNYEKTAEAYPAGCVSQACREAADRAAEAERQAASYSANAETLEGEVERLNAEINSLQSEINYNQAIASDLSVQIALNEEKLNLQQTALAKLLVNIHFEDDPDAIILLAGSSSLSDFSEKQARQTTVKSQIAASADSVKNLKAELENQKVAVDALIATAEANQAEITRKKIEQEALIVKYQNNAEAYAADAAAARETMQREIAAEIAKYNSGGVVGEGYDSYPFSNICPGYTYTAIARGDSAYGGYKCQCTSYAGWKAYEYYGVLISAWGNARYWVGSGSVSKTARGRDGNYHAYRIDRTPAAHTVAVSTLGTFGHVMWVESVNANGTINLSEYNNTASAASGLEGDFGARYNVGPSQYYYIHFDQPLY